MVWAAALFYLQQKCTFKAAYTREMIIKFVVYSICDCLTHSFVCFFVITEIQIIWQISFDFAGSQIIRYVSLTLFMLTSSSFTCGSLFVLKFQLSATYLICKLMFLLVVLLFIISSIFLTMLINSMAGVQGNAGPSTSTKKNLHLTHLSLCHTLLYTCLAVLSLGDYTF